MTKMHPSHNRFYVLLDDPVSMSPPTPEQLAQPTRTAILCRYNFYDEVFGNVIYSCWVPDPGEYSEEDYEKMHIACEKAGVTFQRRLPTDRVGRLMI